MTDSTTNSTHVNVADEANGEQNIAIGISDSLLEEIAERLAVFAKTGEIHKIDLRSLPMSKSDLKNLDDILGIGEVRANLNILGRSDVWESAYAGVWRIVHYGDDDVVVVNEVAIASAPDILFCHRDDAKVAAKRLQDNLNKAKTSANKLSEKEDVAHV